MIVRDRTDGQVQPITHYTGRLVTSDKQAHTEQPQDLGVKLDGQPSQAPKIPGEHESAEVSIVQNIEPCTANYAQNHTGGHQAEGLTAMTPVVAKLEGGNVVKVGLSSNYGHAQAQLNDAHHKSTIVAQDHRDIHQHGIVDDIKHADKCDLAKPGGLEIITDLAEGKGIPPATKSAPSVSIGHPVRASNGLPPLVRVVSRSNEPVIMSKGEGSGDAGAAKPVVAVVNQPRSSCLVSGGEKLQVKTV